MPETLPVLASLTATASLADSLTLLAETASTARPGLLSPSFARAELGRDAFLEAADRIGRTAEAYHRD
jgi:hypothetical protein